MRFILQKAKYIWPGILLISMLGILTSLMGVAFALISKVVLDVATGQTTGNLLQSFMLLGLFLLVQLLLEMALSISNIHVSGKFLIRIKTELFQKILKKEYLKISEFHTGELLNRINSDVSIVTGGLVQMVPNLVFYLTKIIACFLTIYVMDPVFALLCLLIGPLIFFTAWVYRKKMKQLHKDSQAADGRVKSFMQETLKNLLVIKSFGAINAAANKSRSLQFKLFKLNLKRNKISIIANAFFYLGLTAGYYFALAWGAYKIAGGMMTFGTLTALLQLVGQIQTPFQELSTLLPQYYSMVASADRLIEIESLSDDPVTERTPWNNREWSSVRLSGVDFAYDNELILKQTDFQVNQGEFVVITGSSGTGKSTMLKVLLGILPPLNGKAELLLPDGKAEPLYKIPEILFSYVPQGNLIVSGTIRENILFFQTDVSDEEVIRAATVAGIWDYIKELPQGLDTVLGEGGLGLSEGQIQRIAIARGILSPAPILLLDESTSALDETTELSILQSLKEQKDKTCILISHKKAALSFCDRILNFENGQLYEVEQQFV